MDFVESLKLTELSFIKKDKNTLTAITLEITARCNNNCRHCCINLPANDEKAKEKELTLSEIKKIADDAASLGVLWCLISGGEPFLRDDFLDIYLYLKRKGFLVSIYTNATLVTKQHIKIFKKYPPRDIEITVYGITKETYEQVTRKNGSFDAFTRGLNLLIENGIKARLKSVALRSNVHQLPEISRFCRERTKDVFRFDPYLILRFDADPERKEEIKSERLSAEEIVNIERTDSRRFLYLKKGCDKLILPQAKHNNCGHLFHCGIPNSYLTVSYDGYAHRCSLLHPDCIYDLRNGTLAEAWHNFIPKIMDMRSNRKEYLDQCHKCPIINLCPWCPAHSYLETGELDTPIKYFCDVAQARARALKRNPPL